MHMYVMVTNIQDENAVKKSDKKTNVDSKRRGKSMMSKEVCYDNC